VKVDYRTLIRSKIKMCVGLDFPAVWLLWLECLARLALRAHSAGPKMFVKSFGGVEDESGLLIISV
jgi:hypothetical protein